MNQGFILLHRQLLDWEWYDHLPVKVLFIHCLLRANHSSGKWRGHTFKRGEFITSIQSLATDSGLTIKQVRNALEILVNSGELGKVTTSVSTLISVTNYDKYQSEGKPKGKARASEGQSKGKRRANEGQQINNENNENNEENENKDIPASGFDFLTSLIDLGVDKQVANDWMKVRAKLKASNTLTAFKKISAEIEKSGRDANWCITKAVEKNWRGFEAGWIEPEPIKKSAYPPFKIAL